MRVHVLGPVQVAGADGALGPRDRVVLSALVVNLGEPVEAGALAEALWGEHPPPTWPKVVQGCVSRLRRVLGTDAIETTTHGYRLARESVSLDIEDFEALVVRAREQAARGAPERARALYADALAMWRGAPFDALDDWLPGRLETVRLRELRLAAQEEQLQARLDAGEHREVAAEATVLAGEQPYRERRWALLALAQYRGGRQADALSSIRTARRVLGRELGLDPGSELVELEAAILAQDPALAAAHEARTAADACPWKGLASYQAEDHDAFFGRGADIAACLAKLRESPLLVLTGPSGCGKSSLLHAGLVPALRRSGRRVESFTPGADGPLAMAVALAGGRDPILVIDQFEEAFTLGGAVGPTTWLGEIAAYARDRAPVVLAVRADHLALLAADAELARLTEQGLHLVVPLTGADLREAIDGPARLAGLRLEPGLADLVLRDAEGQPGALPLLSHALAETWLRREFGVLTVDGYRDAGGIRDAVAASADRLYESLTAAERGELRWLMLRLVSLSDSGEPFRTQLPVEVATDPRRRRLLDLLVRSRLVTSDAQFYELAHEALARAWPRLRTWLDEDASRQRLRRHLRLASAGWESLGRPASELYRGARLEAVLEWQERENEPIGGVEADFVAASRADAESHLRRLGEQARHQRVQNRRLRLVAASAVALLLVAAVAASSARTRGREADRRRDEAAAAATVVRHEALVNSSLALRSSNRIVAALLAIEAWRDSPDVRSRAALMGTLTSSVGFLGYHTLSLGWNASAAAVPGSELLLATADGGAVGFADPATGHSSGPSMKRVFAVSTNDTRLVVSADGSRAAQLVQVKDAVLCIANFGRAPAPNQTCSLLVVYDLASRQPVMGPVPAIFGATDVALSDDGRTVAVASGDDGDLVVWDVDTATRRGRVPGDPRRPGAGAAVAFVGADRVLLGSPAGRVREISARTMQVQRTFRVPSRSANRAIVTTRSGGVLMAGDRRVSLLDTPTGEVVWSADLGQDGDDACRRMAVALASGRLYCGGSSGLVVERDLATGSRTGLEMSTQLGVVSSVVLTADQTELAVFSKDQDKFALWRLDGTGLGSRLVARGMVATGGYDPTGRFLLAAPANHLQAVRVVSSDGRVELRLPLAGEATWLSASTIAVLGPDPGLVDFPSGRVRRIPVLGPDALSVHAEPDGMHAWSVTATPSGALVVRFGVVTGRPVVGTSAIETDRPAPVHVSSDGETVLVTVEGFLTSQYDVASGSLLGSGMRDKYRTLLTNDGAIIGVDGSGGLTEHEGLGFARPRMTFPRSPGPPSSLELSRDGSRLIVTATDRSVHVYDTATGVTLVGPVSGPAAAGSPAGWLRPDGRAIAVSTQAGVVEWDLEPEALVDAACELAGRNMGLGEWDLYVGAEEPYVAHCAQFRSALTTN